LLAGQIAPNERLIAAVARALGRARNEFLAASLFLPFFHNIGLRPPVLVEGGMVRLRLTNELYESVRARTDLIPQAETALRGPPGTLPSVFSLTDAPPHRDIHRPHYTTQVNLWFCLHDAPAQESLILFPESHRLVVDPHLSNRGDPESWGLGKPVRADLRFGDAVLFSSELYHSSPIHTEGRIRFSWDIRIVGGCFDDNSHYRQNFLPLDALRPIGEPRHTDGPNAVVEFAARHPHHRPNPSDGAFPVTQRLLLTWLQAELKGNGDRSDEIANELLTSRPTSQVAFMAAELLAVPLPLSAKALLNDIEKHSKSYFWTSRAADLSLQHGWRELARRCLLRTVTLASETKVSTDHNPIDYFAIGAPAAQLFPDRALRQARQRLSELARSRHHEG